MGSKKDDKVVYLIGTLHPAKGNINYLNSAMEKVLDNTDALALEVNLNDEKVLEKGQQIGKENLYLEKGELKDLLTKEEQVKLNKVLKDFNIEYNEVKYLSPEGFSAYIEEKQEEQGGFTYSSDQWLQEIYDTNKKNIVGLENVEDHYKLLYELTGDLKAFLAEYKPDLVDKGEQSMEEIGNAFIKGDSEYMEKKSEDLRKADKELYEKLSKNRNINMANEIDKLAQGDNRYAVAVGTLHYFGKDSILKQLEEKGYKINKLEN
ncbi:TraB/GumN family protein [Paraclostridium benzoelyticum]|uniref:TraB/GumN family protein n=1 Tax=Paraclostridium benzoelyticum TaxID=1629550 RepID=UPI0031CD6F2B